MSEEFKPIRITLSDEAYEKLDNIMKTAKFRSYSSTIEECIRVVSDILVDVTIVLGTKGKPWTPFDDSEAYEGFVRIANRMRRFTGRVVVTKEQDKKLRPSSAGP